MMNRSSTMTVGFLLVFIGLQLNLVETFVLSPKATKFWAERWADPAELMRTSYNQATNYQTPNYGSSYSSPYSQVGFASAPQNRSSQLFSQGSTIVVPPKQISPADWLCWPIIFLGSVFVFFGLAVRTE